MCDFLPILVFANCHNKTSQTGWFKQHTFTLSVFEVTSPWWRCQKIQFLPDLKTAIFGLCSQLASPLCIAEGRERKGEPERKGERGGMHCGICFLIRQPDRQVRILMTSFKLNYLPKEPTSEYSHIGSYNFNVWMWRAGLQFSP